FGSSAAQARLLPAPHAAMSPLRAALIAARPCPHRGHAGERDGRPARTAQRRLVLGTIPEDEAEVAVSDPPPKRRAAGLRKKATAAAPRARGGAARRRGPGEPERGSPLLDGLVAELVAGSAAAAQGATDHGPLAAGLMLSADTSAIRTRPTRPTTASASSRRRRTAGAPAAAARAMRPAGRAWRRGRGSRLARRRCSDTARRWPWSASPWTRGGRAG
ncbi:unnamed protein product, partial [Prorocentrum cordatum]